MKPSIMLLSTMVFAARSFVISKNTRGNVEFTPVLQIDQNANSGSTVKYIEVGGLKFSPTDESKAKPDLMAGVRAEVQRQLRFFVGKYTITLSHAFDIFAMAVFRTQESSKPIEYFALTTDREDIIIQCVIQASRTEIRITKQVTRSCQQKCKSL